MRFIYCCICTSIALIAAVDHEGLLSMGDVEYPTSHGLPLNFTLFGAVIISDKKAVAHQLTICASLFHLHDYGSNTSSIHVVLANRKSNMKKLSRQLKPLKLQFWPTVHTRPCPVVVSTVSSQRDALIEQRYVRHIVGLNDADSGNKHHFRSLECPYAAHPTGWSHFQIWQDFVFFDPDLLAARKRNKTPEYLTHR